MNGWKPAKGAGYKSPLKSHGGPHSLTEAELQEMYKRGYQPPVAEQFGGQDSGRWREGSTAPTYDSRNAQMDDMQVKKRPSQWDIDGQRYSYEDGRNKYIDQGLADGSLKHPEDWYRDPSGKTANEGGSVTVGQPYETRKIQGPRVNQETGPQQSYLDTGTPSSLIDGGISFGVDKGGRETVYDPSTKSYRYFEHQTREDGKKNKNYKATPKEGGFQGTSVQHPEKTGTIGTEGDNPGIWANKKRGDMDGHGGMTEQKKIDLAKQGYEGIDSIVGQGHDPRSRNRHTNHRLTDEGHQKGTHRYDIMQAPGGGGEFAERTRIMGDGAQRGESQSRFMGRKDSASGGGNSYDFAMTGGSDTFFDNPVRWNQDADGGRGMFENVDQNRNYRTTDAEVNRIATNRKLNINNVGQHIRGDVYPRPSNERDAWNKNLFADRSSVKGTTKTWLKNLDGVPQPSYVERYMEGKDIKKKTQREKGKLDKLVDKTKFKDGKDVRTQKGGFLGSQKKKVWEDGKLVYDFRSKDGVPYKPIKLEKKTVKKIETKKTPTTLPKPKKVTSPKTEKSNKKSTNLKEIKLTAKGPKTKLEKKTVKKIPTKPLSTKLPKPKPATKTTKTKAPKTKTTKTKTPKQKREKKDGNIFTRTKDKIQSKKSTKTKKPKRTKKPKGGGSPGILSKFRDEILGPKQ